MSGGGRAAALLLAAALVLLGALAGRALSEADPAGAFSGMWVLDDCRVDIWTDEGRFQCLGSEFVNDEEGSTWYFTDVRYDAGAGALVCEGGTLRVSAPDPATGEVVETVAATGFGATLTLDGEGRLHWTGSGDALPDRVLIPLEAADDGPEGDESDAGLGEIFVDRWVCGRAVAEIAPEGDQYRVEITWGDGADREYRWSYLCDYDNDAVTLTGVGGKAVVTLDGRGGESAEAVYEDGPVRFTIGDNDGALLWDDGVEDAGRGLRFRREYELDG